jgi:tripartite motif-containing protein 71
MDLDPITGDIYITDTGNNRIIKVDQDFNFVTLWSSTGKTESKFSHPHGIGVDTSGNVYVNDLNDARIQKFDKNGNFIKQWGSEGTKRGQFTLPLEHLFIDPFDNV